MQQRQSFTQLAQVMGLTLALLTLGAIGDVREAGAQPGANKTLDVIGLSDVGQLVGFRTSAPRRPKLIGAVTGLVGDTSLIGIDFRVQDGLLYGVGNLGGIYTINTTTAVATPVDSLDIAPSGTFFGVDFNPVANALRVISDSGQNLRHPFATMVTASDTMLSIFPAVPPALGISGGGYTNDDLDANTGTTLFDIDTTNDTVVIQSPANSGQLVVTGKLGVDADPGVGFDIYTAFYRGTIVANRGFATLSVGGVRGFYKIDLLTGLATKVRDFETFNVVDIAIPLAQ